MICRFGMPFLAAVSAVADTLSGVLFVLGSILFYPSLKDFGGVEDLGPHLAAWFFIVGSIIMFLVSFKENVHLIYRMLSGEIGWVLACEDPDETFKSLQNIQVSPVVQSVADNHHHGSSQNLFVKQGDEELKKENPGSDNDDGNVAIFLLDFQNAHGQGTNMIVKNGSLERIIDEKHVDCENGGLTIYSPVIANQSENTGGITQEQNDIPAFEETNLLPILRKNNVKTLLLACSPSKCCVEETAEASGQKIPEPVMYISSHRRTSEKDKYQTSAMKTKLPARGSSTKKCSDVQELFHTRDHIIGSKYTFKEHVNNTQHPCCPELTLKDGPSQKMGQNKGTTVQLVGYLLFTTSSILFITGSVYFLPDIYVNNKSTGCSLFVAGCNVYWIAFFWEFVRLFEKQKTQSFLDFIILLLPVIGAILFMIGSLFFYPRYLVEEYDVYYAVTYFVVGSSCFLADGLLKSINLCCTNHKIVWIE